MKRSLLFFILLVRSSLFAQVPEYIYGKNRVLHSNEYYLQQKELWREVAEKDPRDPNAWYNYYRADRNAYIVGEETDSLNTKGINRFHRLNKIVEEMEKNVPESYQFYFVKWLNGNNDLSLLPYLEKAHELSPYWVEPLMSLIYCYELNGSDSLRNKYAKLYYESGDFSPGLLSYGTNLIAGLPADAIILTEGDKDTDAILILQHGKKIASGIRLINLNLLLNKEYRKRIFDELMIPSWTDDPLQDESSFKYYHDHIITHIAKNAKKRPVYVATSVSSDFTGPISRDLYNTGLASLYSKRKVKNIPLIEKNFKELYSLDYLRSHPPGDISESMIHRFNMNYLPALEELIGYYSKRDPNRSIEYKALSDKIRADSPDKEVTR